MEAKMVDRIMFTPKADKDKPQERLEEVLKFIADRLSDIDENIQEVAALLRKV